MRAGSVVATTTGVAPGTVLAPRLAVAGSASTRSSTASGDTVASGSSATAMSHVWTACSLSRMAVRPSRSRVPPNISTANALRSSVGMSSMRATSVSLAATLSATCSAGGLAFQRSQMARKASWFGGSVPSMPASRKRAKISAWLPRWEATSAMLHSSS